MSRSVLRTQHTSLQESDSKAQQKHDVKRLFATAKNFPVKTGTESGQETYLHGLLQDEAKAYNHVLHFARGNFVAVDRDIVKRGSVKRGLKFVESTKNVVGPGHDLVLATLAFTHVDPRIGRISQGAAHFATQGSKPGDPNYQANVKYAGVIHDWMTQAGAKSALAFVNGDFNTNDKIYDWNHGKNWTSMGDELKKYPNTGHGPIDGFASYNKDGRVSAKRLVVMDDKKLKMHSDHFVVRGVWWVKHLEGIFEGGPILPPNPSPL